MKIRTLLLSAAICFAAATAMGQAKDEKGFKTIFDGKTFDGWKKAEENPDTWTIKDGAFVAAGLAIIFITSVTRSLSSTSNSRST